MSEPTRQQQIDSIRAICDFLESHPDFNLPNSFADAFCVFVSGKGEFASHVKLLGSGTKSVDDTFFRFSHDFGAAKLELIEWRNVICERVVVGTQEVESEEADPVALAALPKVKVKKQIELVEWRCPDSILNNAEEAVNA